MITVKECGGQTLRCADIFYCVWLLDTVFSPHVEFLLLSLLSFVFGC